MIFWRAAAIVVLAMGAAACSQPPPRREPEIVWRELGKWSGRGQVQTESFTGETGSLRIQWRTQTERAPGAGNFELTIHSAISGRPLQTAVDQKGAAEGTAYVAEDPRVFFAVVDSAGLDWAFTIEEGVSR